MSRENNQQQSIRAKLKKLANDRAISFELAQTEFLLERAVFRLCTDQNLSRHLVFKGGYVGVRCYESNRSTVDIDALIHGMPKKEVLEKAKSSIENNINDGTWFQFEKEINLLTQGEYGGTRLRFRGGIGDKPVNISKHQIIDLDLGIGDAVTPITINLDAMIFDEQISWKVYPVESMCSEKLHALADKGEFNSRSKDIYDLYQYLSKCDPKALKDSLVATFSARETSLPPSFAKFFEAIDKSVLKRGWQSLIRPLREKIDFEVCANFIFEWLSENKI